MVVSSWLFYSFDLELGYLFVIIMDFSSRSGYHNSKIRNEDETDNHLKHRKKSKGGFDDITSKFSNIDHEKIANTAKSELLELVLLLKEVITTIFKYS